MHINPYGQSGGNSRDSEAWSSDPYGSPSKSDNNNNNSKTENILTPTKIPANLINNNNMPNPNNTNMYQQIQKKYKQEDRLVQDRLGSLMSTVDTTLTEQGAHNKKFISALGETGGNDDIKGRLLHYLLSLSKAPRMTDPNVAKNTLEVEMRFGAWSSTFNSKINSDDFHMLRTHLEKSFSGHDAQFQLRKTLFTTTSDYGYPDAIRISYSDEEKRILSRIRKEKDEPFHIKTTSKIPYDIRLGFAVETPLDIPPHLPENWETKREKFRSSFFFDMFKVELTSVVTTNKMRIGQPDSSCELEIELAEKFITIIRNIAHLGVKELENRVQQLYDFILFLFKPLTTPASHPDIPMVPHTNKEEILEMRKIVYSLISPIHFDKLKKRGEAADWNTLEFPGSMPVNFSRRHLPLIQNSQNQYWVSEKTDGIRYLLLVEPNYGVFLIGRKFDFYNLSSYAALSETVWPTGVTLLDGEIIRNLETQKPVFLVFDIVALQGQNCASQPFHQRMESIKQVILGWRKWESSIGSQSVPFEIIGKSFFPANSIGALYKNIQITKTGERIYKDSKRHHKSDGVIFTPNLPYFPKRCDKLFKWKYPDELSVDFKFEWVHPNHPNPENRTPRPCFTVRQDGDRDLVYDHIVLSDQDHEKLQREMVRLRKRTVIVELCFHASDGLWHYKMVRTDKELPNYVSILFDTLQAVSENVSLEELVYRIPRIGVRDDWKDNMRKYYKQMISSSSHSQPQQHSK